MKILIIDDDQNIVGIWTIALKSAGFEVFTAITGNEGNEKAKTHQPEFILLDQIIPDMKGNDVLRILKDDPKTKDIPVAFVSNYSEPQMMQEAIQQGAVDYILKYQVEAADLISKIQTLTKKTTDTTT
jgi:CheY-like chemotaxis protein